MADRYSCHAMYKRRNPANGVMTRQSTEDDPRHANVKPMACRLQTWMDADGPGLSIGVKVESRTIPCSCDVMVDFLDVVGGKASSMSVKKMAVVRSVCFVVSLT